MPRQPFRPPRLMINDLVANAPAAVPRRLALRRLDEALRQLEGEMQRAADQPDIDDASLPLPPLPTDVAGPPAPAPAPSPPALSANASAVEAVASVPSSVAATAAAAVAVADEIDVDEDGASFYTQRATAASQPSTPSSPYVTFWRYRSPYSDEMRDAREFYSDGASAAATATASAAEDHSKNRDIDVDSLSSWVAGTTTTTRTVSSAAAAAATTATAASAAPDEGDLDPDHEIYVYGEDNCYDEVHDGNDTDNDDDNDDVDGDDERYSGSSDQDDDANAAARTYSATDDYFWEDEIRPQPARSPNPSASSLALLRFRSTLRAYDLAVDKLSLGSTMEAQAEAVKDSSERAADKETNLQCTFSLSSIDTDELT
jgi:hypothetical protein